MATLQKKKRWAGTVLCALFLSFFAQPAGAAGSYSGPDEEFGWTLYFKYHPAKKHFNPYPYDGPVIEKGQTIPVCKEAQLLQAYLFKKELKVISQGKDGWLFRTADFRTDFAASPRAMEYFRRLNQALAAHGQVLIAAFQAPRGMLAEKHLDPAHIPAGYDPAQARQSYKAFIRQLRSAGIMALDLSDVPEGLEYFPKGDFHWSSTGAGWTAQKVAELIRKLPGYVQLEKKNFETKITGQAKNPAHGAFEAFIQSTCKVNIRMQPVDLWTTDSQKDGSAKADSLLGEAAYPAVTVLGTSNSAEDPKFNFVGSLKHFLHADVYNAAVVAGGFGSSSYRYYASDEYRANPPKFVVWEFLPQHEYNSEISMAAFRQMIPAVYGACDEKDAAATYKNAITTEKFNIFKGINEKSLKDAYLYMEVSEPAERNLRVELLYANGDADQVDMTRSTRVPNNGKYFLELEPKTNQSLLFMRLLTDRPQGQVNARLCHYPVTLASR
jgi:alginate biosynthesis protein AlgX